MNETGVAIGAIFADVGETVRVSNFEDSAIWFAMTR